jgi:hypothetical protein
LSQTQILRDLSGCQTIMYASNHCASFSLVAFSDWVSAAGTVHRMDGMVDNHNHCLYLRSARLRMPPPRLALCPCKRIASHSRSSTFTCAYNTIGTNNRELRISYGIVEYTVSKQQLPQSRIVRLHDVCASYFCCDARLATAVGLRASVRERGGVYDTGSI